MSAKGRVLLVDDDRDLLRLMVLRVGAAGYETVAAASGAEALAHLAAERPDVVVTDLRMEGMDGLALFDAVAARHPSLPVIIITAHGSVPEAVEAMRRGVFSFLVKPIEGRALLAEIGRAIRLVGESGPGEEWRDEIVTRSPEMEELLAQAKLLARSDACVLLRGATGTGKEVLARAIHRASPRRARPFVAVNCAAIPETLLESELFGHVRGAFTGASSDYPGLFRSAHLGTLLLDEIGDMPPVLQAKLLRVLQDKRVRPVGAVESVPADVRIIAATHRDLEAAVAAERFREDLYYRLNVAQLELPALEQRREDIPLLAGRHLAGLAARDGRPVQGFAPDALELLARSAWPGNVRQLLNVVEQAFVLCTAPLVPAALIRKALRAQDGELASLEEARARFEREYLVRLLKLTDGNVARAARLAQRNRTEFYKLLGRHGLDAGAFKPATG